MTLVTLVFAWLLVLALFLAVARAAHGPLVRSAVMVTVAEALVLTLLAGLWFGTAGRGGWLLVFVLLGALVAGSERGQRAFFRQPRERPDWRGFWLDLGRYVLAGAALAWRLG
jgi:hypothetical protein